ncbi:MAG TPA: chemotaxis protein CheA [Longimicrobiales bacterium]|nr:chemotaxis protein CheA [Longimicrobiales bacterium]
MELNRYLDLYLSESQDHLRLLNKALLDLEEGDATAAIEEAFRAAHTLKGMSATMGFTGVSDIAHDLETLLDHVRAGERTVDAQVIDELLADADLLERGIAAAASGDPVPEKPKTTAATTAAATAPAPAAAPKKTIASLLAGTSYVRVSLKPDEIMKIARALIMTRTLVQRGLVERSEPEQFGDDFDGEFALILKEGADEQAVTDVLSNLPEIASYSFEKSKTAPAAAPKAAAPAANVPAPASGSKTNFLRVDQRRMDELAEGLGEMAILQGRVEQLVYGQHGQLGDLVTRITRLINELQHTVLAVRMVPVGDVFERFPRMVRDAARALGKEIDFQVEGREIEIDRSILEEIVDPLVHLLRNAIDHGIEPPAERYGAGKDEKATLVLRAWRDRSSVRIQVEEDGRGVNVKKVLTKARAKGVPTPETNEISNEDLLRILAHPGFSTAEQITDVSGRGVGLDAVVAKIRALGGAIDMQTRLGEGTTFTLRLPITLAIAQALRVRVGDEDYAIPLTHVAEALELDAVTIDKHKGREVVRLRDEVLPLVRLRAVLHSPTKGSETAAVVAELGERRTALAVDRLVGREQILVKQFDSAVGTLPIFSGVTLLADGRPALVLDPISVV